VQAGEPAMRVCEPSEFVGTIAHLLQDESAAAALGSAARSLVDQLYSWDRISPSLGLRLRRTRATLNDHAPFFTVVIPTYERHDKLWEVVEALADQTFTDFEVVVVDQSRERWPGRDSYPELELLYIHTDVKGATLARNTGAFHARGTVLAFTDDDCLPFPEWLERARGYFDQEQLIGVEGLISSDKRFDPNYRAVTNEGFEGLGFMTANLFLRREVFMAVDGFDPSFDHPHFREDTDLGWRASAHGQFAFAHDVCVYHPPHPRSIGREDAVQRARFFEKDALLLRKHPDRYRELFLSEAHFRLTEGFRENFLHGAEKYGVAIDEFYLEHLAARA